MSTKQDAEAVFAWHLHIDTAFLRAMLSYGFKTIEEALAALECSGSKTKVDQATARVVRQWTKAHQRFDKSFTKEMLLDPKRWACHSDKNDSTNLEDLLKLYENWMWQITHLCIASHNPKTPLFKALNKAYLWHIQCESSHYHMKIGLYDHDRLYHKGKKLSAEQLRTRAYISDLPTCFEDHPMYPQEFLGRFSDKNHHANGA